MTKKQAIIKVNSILKKSMATLAKDIDAVLKEANVWYCIDDLIKSQPALCKKNDRNGDQLMIDFAIQTYTEADAFCKKLDEKMLWTKDDLATKQAIEETKFQCECKDI